MAEDRVDRPVTVADLQALQSLIAEIQKSMQISRQEAKAGFDAASQDLEKAKQETKAGFKAASQEAKMHVEVLRQEVKADLDAAMKETKAEIAGLRRELADGLERVETKLLTSFHGWARTYESKSRGLSTLVVTFEERLSLAEDRLNRLERGETN